MKRFAFLSMISFHQTLIQARSQSLSKIDPQFLGGDRRDTRTDTRTDTRIHTPSMWQVERIAELTASLSRSSCLEVVVSK
jgi:hypothetical protein